MKTSKLFLAIAALAMVSLLGGAQVIFAQEVRGSISGRITDPTGAALPGARVSVINTETNVPVITTTNEEGSYTASFLLPGLYRVTAEASGYKKLVRDGVQVRVEDKLELNLTMEVGALSETVNVTSQAPLLETNTASLGQVMESRLISELPLPDGNPFLLSRLAPGVLDGGLASSTAPYDGNSTSRISTNGVGGRSSFWSLDNAPNTSYENRVAAIPPADSVDEFKIVTNSFDAQQGRTGGASINVSTKSGKNRMFGSLYEFIRNDAIAANSFFNNLAGTRRAALRYNRFGGTIGGPVVLPEKVFGPASYNGRDRTFFFFAYEGIRNKNPNPIIVTVPTLTQRQGNFAGLQPIYDPTTAVQVGARVERQPFANNVIPTNRISPMAQAFLQYIPLPNLRGDAEGRNNFYSDNLTSNDYNSYTARVDHNFSPTQRSFLRYSKADTQTLRGIVFPITNGVYPTGVDEPIRTHSMTLDHVWTATSSTILNLRGGVSFQRRRATNPTIDQVSPSALGFSARALSQFEPIDLLPGINITDYQRITGGLPERASNVIYSAQPTLTQIHGNHSVKFGYDFRLYRDYFYDNRPPAGDYSFDSSFTRRFDNSVATFGQSFASFLLGIPTGGTIQRPLNRASQQIYHGFFLQDDWKITRRLTLNLGLRYDLDQAPTERFDRNIRGFDLAAAAAPEIEAAARRAFATAANKPAEAASNFPTLRGGYLFTDADNRAQFVSDKNNFQPRIGFAFQLTEKTVIRGGFGLFDAPLPFDQFFLAPGFSQATTLVATDNNGLNFNPALNRPCLSTCGTFADPFPVSSIEPPNRRDGLATSIGRAIVFYQPGDVRNEQYRRFQLGVQRELPGQLLVEVDYVANYGYNLQTVRNINATPAQYLSRSPLRDQAAIDFLTLQSFTNPFRNLLPSDTALGRNANVSREVFLRPFPQFEAVNARAFDGTQTHHSGQLRVEKRFSQGYTFTLAYTFSKTLEQITLLNPTDEEYERRLAANDAPHRLSVAGIFELPFGRGRKFGGDLPKALDVLLGGFQLGVVYQYQSGFPLTLGNVYFAGNGDDLRATINGQAVAGNGLINNIFGSDIRTSGFYLTDAQVQTNGQLDFTKQRNDTRIQLDRNLRTLPSRFGWLRDDGRNNLDFSLMKKFRLRERTELQFRAEAINAFNHAIFNVPDLNPRNAAFGTVSGQANLPRYYQLGLRLTF